jgi:hypothetical protein
LSLFLFPCLFFNLPIFSFPFLSLSLFYLADYRPLSRMTDSDGDGDGDGVIIENEEQLWNGESIQSSPGPCPCLSLLIMVRWPVISEVSKVVATECAAHAHEAIDNALRAWLSLASRCRRELALSEDDVAVCAQHLLHGSLFIANPEYVRTQIIYSLLQDDETAHLYPIASFLLLDGRADEMAFRKMIEESCFQRLIELINDRKEEDPGLHLLLLELIYEMSRIQQLGVRDLIQVDDGFVASLFQLIEGLSDDIHDPCLYPVIRVLVCRRTLLLPPLSRLPPLRERLAHKGTASFE